MTRSKLTAHSAEPIQPGDLLTEIEAAEAMHVAVRTLRNWRALHKGPRFRKIGQRLVRYHRVDLAAFINGCES